MQVFGPLEETHTYTGRTCQSGLRFEPSCYELTALSTIHHVTLCRVYIHPCFNISSISNRNCSRNTISSSSKRCLAAVDWFSLRGIRVDLIQLWSNQMNLLPSNCEHLFPHPYYINVVSDHWSPAVPKAVNIFRRVGSISASLSTVLNMGRLTGLKWILISIEWLQSYKKRRGNEEKKKRSGK